MASSFEIALSNYEFNDIKEKELVSDLNSADDLCSYINSFLPKQLTGYVGFESEVRYGEENRGVTQGSKSTIFGDTSRAKTIEELHNRIEKLRGKKVNYKEKLLKKGLKNRLKKKQKLEERKQLKNASRKLDPSNNVLTQVEHHSNETEKKINISQPESMQFNKILVSAPEKDSKIKTNDPKRILQQIEKKNQKLKELEIKGKKEKVIEIKNREAWDAAIKKAEGLKIKDNVELLKKSILKTKQRKCKSKKKWEDRENCVKSKKEEAQKKRLENIAKKRKERSKKRSKMLVKKGRILPK